MEHQFYSQSWIQQDRFVAETLNFKTNGFFVDIGCNHYKDISNTYFFEKNLNWRGLAVDINEGWRNEWSVHRPNTHFIGQDATTIDYQSVLENVNAPNIIDYLSIDTEPPEISLKCLKKILEASFKYRVITFETDYYTGDMSGLEESRKILTQMGYTFVKEVGRQDDFWINYNIE